MDDIMATFKVSAAGMRVQGERLRVIAQNIANADSLPTRPGDLPYQRKIITFKNVLDKKTGVELIRTGEVKPDRSAFGLRYIPGHPAANADGYVQTPNVDVLIEMMDMREAQRSYQANLSLIRSSRRMLQRTIDLLRR